MPPSESSAWFGDQAAESVAYVQPSVSVLCQGEGVATRRLLNPKVTRIVTFGTLRYYYYYKVPEAELVILCASQSQKEIQNGCYRKKGNQHGKRKPNEKWTQNRNRVILAPLSQHKFLFGVTEHVVCLFTSPRRQEHKCNFSGGNDLLNGAKSHPEETLQACKLQTDRTFQRPHLISPTQMLSCFKNQMP